MSIIRIEQSFRIFDRSINKQKHVDSEYHFIFMVLLDGISSCNWIALEAYKRGGVYVGKDEKYRRSLQQQQQPQQRENSNTWTHATIQNDIKEIDLSLSHDKLPPGSGSL